MDISLGVVVSVLGLLTTWNVWLEKRFYDMAATFEKRIEERNEINHVVQEVLKEKIDRLEHKIDMLINLQITKALSQGRSDNDKD